MRLRLTVAADLDLVGIARDTVKNFGSRQAERYSPLISHAFWLLRENPERPSSMPRPEIRDSGRSFHLELAAGKRGAASHVVYYRVKPDGEGRHELVILRVLSDRMEPKYRVARALESDADAGGDPSPQA